MRNIRPLIIVLAVSASILLGCNKASESVQPIYPEKAVAVLTEERWGCITGQRILSETGRTAELSEIKNPEDRNDRNELLLFFPARKLSSLEGYFILRISVMHPDPAVQGQLSIREPALVQMNNSISLQFQGTATGKIRADLLYSRRKDIEPVLITCPEADIFEPVNARLFRVYPLKAGLKISITEPSTYRAELPSQFISAASDIDLAEQLLEALDSELRIAGLPIFVWGMEGISENRLKAMISKHGRERKFSVSLNIRNRGRSEIISTVAESVLPALKQGLILKKQDGHTVPGEISISVDR
jgi:hypothetical protein